MIMRIFFEYGQYSIFRDKILGGGTFGTVYAGFDNLKFKHIAVKHITNSSEEFSSQEIEVLMRLTEHDNIVRFYVQFCSCRTLLNSDAVLRWRDTGKSHGKEMSKD